VAVGGTPTFTRCRFEDLSAQKGIVYWDSTGLTGPDFMSFMQCNFIRCETSDGMRGAVAWVDCDDCEGNPPLVVLSDCGFRDNQGMSGPGAGWNQFDTWTPYFPMFRIGNDLRLNSTVPGVAIDDQLPGDINGDGFVTTEDLAELADSLGTCAYDGDFNGVIDIEDLLGVIASYGSGCP
jgi:hypothetical protein